MDGEDGINYIERDRGDSTFAHFPTHIRLHLRGCFSLASLQGGPATLRLSFADNKVGNSNVLRAGAVRTWLRRQLSDYGQADQYLGLTNLDLGKKQTKPRSEN